LSESSGSIHGGANGRHRAPRAETDANAETAETDGNAETAEGCDADANGDSVAAN
jgi:hypothetical protein